MMIMQENGRSQSHDMILTQSNELLEKLKSCKHADDTQIQCELEKRKSCKHAVDTKIQCFARYQMLLSHVILLKSECVTMELKLPYPNPVTNKYKQLATRDAPLGVK